MATVYGYDIWVNWSDGSNQGFEIPQYFEWRREDNVDLMEQMPILKISKAFFNYIENECEALPEEMLTSVYRKSAKVVKNKRKKVDYAMIVTDGEQVLAIDTEGKDNDSPNLKSRVTPKQEAFIIDVVEDMYTNDFGWVQPEPEQAEVEEMSIGDAILTIQPEYMAGLTRTEKEMKVIVLDGLFNISCSNNSAEVAYWYVEMFPQYFNTDRVATLTNEEMVTEMFDFLKLGWSKQHEEFGTAVVKCYDIFKELWAELVGGKNKVKSS